MKHGVDLMPLDSLLNMLWQRKERTTLLGIGPMSPLIIRASLELAQEREFPVFFIASRNQVDCDSFGGGYVAGWDQSRFSRLVQKIAEEIDFAGLFYLCRDHGGPWQRDEEYSAQLSSDTAMQRAKESYKADILAGFDILHIDPTKDPHCSTVDLAIVIERAIELIEYTETVKQEHGIAREIGYEIGTEETKGGYIGDEVFRHFLSTAISRLRAKGLPKPSFIVGQTGTLVRVARNVGKLDIDLASRLSAIAKDEFSVGFKEHNADYLDDAQLRLHPIAGITAANVAPEFGGLETQAYLKEHARELSMVQPHQSSSFKQILTEAVLENVKWRKWLTDDQKDMSAEELVNEPSLLQQIILACGHYVFDDATVAEAIERMWDNQRRAGDTGGKHRVLEFVKCGLDRYVNGFNLAGLLHSEHSDHLS